MRVEVKNHQVTVGETGIPLLGGEVHYWRLAPEVWRACLARVRELGLQVVASYICWDFHEFAPGRFDFTGRTDPRRNLVGFLNLLTEMGTWIIIRPGPYVYTEWSNGGVPDAAARYHRLHPEFLRLAERYMAAVTPVIAPYFATRGGRIILLQADNELDPWQQWHTTELGLGTIPGPFQAFLARRYGEIGQLNAAWHSAYPSFDAARAVMALPAGREDLLPRYLDYCRFRHDYVLTATRWAVETYRRLGVDVPIT